MEDFGPVKEKLRKKIKRSSVMRKKSSKMEDVVSKLLPTLEVKEDTNYLIPEDQIRKTEKNAVKELGEKKLSNER